MSTRSSIWVWEVGRRGRGIHIYHEMLNDRIYLEVGRNYGFHFPIATARVGRRYLRRRYRGLASEPTTPPGAERLGREE